VPNSLSDGRNSFALVFLFAFLFFVFNYTSLQSVKLSIIPVQALLQTLISASGTLKYASSIEDKNQT